MISLDTNILVRVVTRDDQTQLSAINDFLLGRDEPCLVPVTVTLELESVLRFVYKLKGPAMLNAFFALLDNAFLLFEHRSAIWDALHVMTHTRAGFADGLHLALATASGHTPFVTLDVAASRLSGARHLGFYGQA